MGADNVPRNILGEILEYCRGTVRVGRQNREAGAVGEMTHTENQFRIHVEHANRLGLKGRNRRLFVRDKVEYSWIREGRKGFSTWWLLFGLRMLLALLKEIDNNG